MTHDVHLRDILDVSGHAYIRHVYLVSVCPVQLQASTQLANVLQTARHGAPHGSERAELTRMMHLRQ